jgi:hypothetical protein
VQEEIMRKLQSVSALFVMLGAVTAAQALTIVVPLDKESWFKYPAVDGGTQVGASMGTVTNAADHLIATKTTATGGSPEAWFLGRDTVATYNLQNATLRYQWKLDGLGTFAGTYNGLRTDGHGPLAYVRGMTVAWTYYTTLIPNDTWLYTEYKFSEAGHMWEYSIGTGGYGGTSIAHGHVALASTSWDALKTARPYFSIQDNYKAGAHFELAEMTITPVPEPATAVLMLAGLAAIGVVARRATA